MKTENVIDAMNKINENIVISKLVYRNKIRRTNTRVLVFIDN